MSKILEIDKEVIDMFNRMSSKNILEKLRTLRQGINKEGTARRLIWELIQNACDNATICQVNGTNNVNINISLRDKKFEFSHDNGYFTNKNIISLIRRLSSEDKESELKAFATAPSILGRFGTGFMTTHLLSEIVDVKGVYKNEDSYKEFSLTLDLSIYFRQKFRGFLIV